MRVIGRRVKYLCTMGKNDALPPKIVLFLYKIIALALPGSAGANAYFENLVS